MYNSMPFHTPRPFAPSPRPYVPLTTLLQSPRNRLHQVCFVTLRGSRGHDPALPPLSRKRAYPVSFTAYVPFLGPLCHSLALCAAPWPVAPLLGPLRRSLALCATLQGPLRHLQGPMCHSQQPSVHLWVCSGHRICVSSAAAPPFHALGRPSRRCCPDSCRGWYIHPLSLRGPCPFKYCPLGAVLLGAGHPTAERGRPGSGVLRRPRLYIMPCRSVRAAVCI